MNFREPGPQVKKLMGMGSTRSKPRSHLAIAGTARRSFLQSPRPYFPLFFQCYTGKGLALLVAAQTLSVPESDPTILPTPHLGPCGYRRASLSSQTKKNSALSSSLLALTRQSFTDLFRILN